MRDCASLGGQVAFILSGNYGRGAMTCRSGEHFTGRWSAPAMMRLEGGGLGLQLGGQATDFVLLVMNPRGAESILKSEVKLGADAAAAAGPKGRDASAATDATLRAEILTYSRSRGLFAGDIAGRFNAAAGQRRQSESLRPQDRGPRHRPQRRRVGAAFGSATGRTTE